MCFFVLETSSSPPSLVAPLGLFIGTERWCQHSPLSFPTLHHLCLYLSLLPKMLFPSPVPQGSNWWREGRKNQGRQWERASTWLEGRKIISARRLCLRLKPYLHFKSSGRLCCHLRDTIDQPACHLMSADTEALMKLIEQPMIDNHSARQRRGHLLRDQASTSFSRCRQLKPLHSNIISSEFSWFLWGNLLFGVKILEVIQVILSNYSGMINLLRLRTKIIKNLLNPCSTLEIPQGFWKSHMSKMNQICKVVLQENKHTNTRLCIYSSFFCPSIDPI